MVVCSGVLFGWYGADVTWRIFFENFIGSMVTIDANDSCANPRNRASGRFFAGLRRAPLQPRSL
ncbi:hypothetical protein B6D51_00525 [Pseudomonas chlororaphis subsp. chlororaphis]|nr:hypothetical protein B6D51_00525 [Pseudomonas chlororaphis subsp. chlororaphis]